MDTKTAKKITLGVLDARILAYREILDYRRSLVGRVRKDKKWRHYLTLLGMRKDELNIRVQKVKATEKMLLEYELTRKELVEIFNEDE